MAKRKKTKSDAKKVKRMSRRLQESGLVTTDHKLVFAILCDLYELIFECRDSVAKKLKR